MIPWEAEVAEPADARVSKTRDRKVMWVRFPPSAFSSEGTAYEVVGTVEGAGCEVKTPMRRNRW